MMCEYCGSTILSGTSFCSACGANAGIRNKAAIQPESLMPHFQPYEQQFNQPFTRPRMNPMALTGGIIGLASIILNCLGIVAILALIFSIIGLSQINKNGDRGRGWAITGIILGIIGIIWGILVITLWSTIFAYAFSYSYGW